MGFFTLLQDEPTRSRRVVFIGALLLCLLLSGGGIGYVLRGIVSSRPSSSRPVFLLLGDSITQFGSNVTNRGWVPQLQAEYVRRADVINRGVSGVTTRALIRGELRTIRKELERWIQPTLITVWLGANDAADPVGSHAFLTVPVDEYRKNLEFILEDLASLAPHAKILLLTPPTVDAEKRRIAQAQSGDARDPADRTNERTGAYAAACKALGDVTPGVTTLDVYDYFMTTYPNATERATLLVDGLHMTAAGNDVVFNLINQEVQRLLPEVAKLAKLD